MASTYVNDLRLNEMATGDASGSWGTVTNTNLELIGEAFGYGTETIGNADTTITVADGAADPARSFYLKIASSTNLSTTRIITLAPNTVSKVWIIENATGGSQIITIKQGSGATINIPNGHVKMIASNGGGSGAVIYDLLTDLNVATNLFVKNAGTGDGSTANIYLQTAEADIAADDVIGKINFQAPNEGTGTDAILVSAAIQAISEGDFSSTSNATSLNFMTGASEAATTKMTLSSGGNLTVTGDVNVGGTALVTGVLTTTAAAVFNGGFTSNGDTVTFASANANDPVLIVKNTTADATSTRLHFVKDGGRNGVNGDDLAEIDFIGDNAAQQQTTFGRIEALIASAADGAEGGKIRMRVATHDGEMQSGLIINDGSAEDEIDVTIGFGAASNTTISGKLLTADGGAGLPSHSFSGDTNTGMFSSAADTLQFSTGGTERTRITSDGQVLIGATASQSVTLSNGNALQIQGLSSNTSGISTTRHSNDSGGPYFNFGKSRGTADGAVTAVADNDILGQIFFSGADGTDILTPAASIQAFVDGTPSGNDMPGRLVFSTTADGADAATERFRISSDGSLSTLTLGTSNVRFGVNAGNSIASGGNYNVFLGDEAGTANTIGDENVAVGYNALAANISGDRSTAVGYQALVAQKNADNSTYDANNTAIGFNAMVAMTSGLRNVAIGSGALDLEDTGSRSVAIGFSALSDQNADTSNYNVAVGYDAGAKVSLGVQNTIVGAQAGDLLDEADRNVVIGYQALTADHKGDRTVAIGAFALAGQDFTSVTSTNNVAVGYESGGALTTGASNTLIGSQTGVYISTANNSTFMGFKAGQGITGTRLTGNDNVAIGKSAGLLLQGAAADNTFVGTESGAAITTGHSSVAIGSSALLTEDTGRKNVAIGFEALTTQNADVDNNNTAVGFQAGRLTSTGIDDTFVGNLSGDENSTGLANTFIGSKAGQFNTTGDVNTFIGASAGHGVDGTELTGNGNTAVGQGAGQDLQGAANSNTILGRDAGANVSTGNENVIIGYDAGSHNIALATGARNVIIGAYADTTATDTDDANVIGQDVSGAEGYTTLGSSSSDIRAAHGNVTWATVSDQRYKKDIVDSTAGLSFINALKPRTFKYKNLGELPETFSAYKADSTEVFKNSNTNHGFIAQEVKTAIDADSGIKDGFKLWAERDDGGQELAEAALIPMLTKAVQELSTALDAALARIATLEG